MARRGSGYGYFKRGVFGVLGVNGSVGVGLIRMGEYSESEREWERPNISVCVASLYCHGNGTNIKSKPYF